MEPREPERCISLAQRINPTHNTSTKLLSDSVPGPVHLIDRLFDLPLESLLLLDELGELFEMRALSRFSKAMMLAGRPSRKIVTYHVMVEGLYSSAQVFLELSYFTFASSAQLGETCRLGLTEAVLNGLAAGSDLY